jgi:hypothetical protein
MSSYKMQRDAAGNLVFADIGGATAQTYLVDIADQGNRLRGARDDGAGWLYSAPTGLVLPAGSMPPAIGTSLYARMAESSAIGTPPGGANTHTVSSVSAYYTALAAAADGDLIYLHGGNYGPLLVGTGGAMAAKRADPANPITTLNYPGETVRMAGASVKQGGSNNSFYLGDCTGLRFRGETLGRFVIDTPFGNGLRIECGASLEFDRMIIRNAGRGAGVSYGCMGLLAGGGNTAVPAGRRFIEDLQIWNSKIYNNGVLGGAGRDHQTYMGTGGSLKLSHSSEETGIRSGQMVNTVIYDGPAGSMMQFGDSCRDFILACCTIFRAYDPTAGSAVVLWDGRGASDPGSAWGTKNFLLVNSIISDNLRSAVIASDSKNAVNNQVKKTLAARNAAADFIATYGSFTGFSVDSDSHSWIDNDPGFVDATARDFRLTSGSFAKAKADPNFAPPYDITGAVRSVTPSLGAYE